ncbi:hypothetical protein JCM5350_001325 [Sporobolomyces pararoseus]
MSSSLGPTNGSTSNNTLANASSPAPPPSTSTTKPTTTTGGGSGGGSSLASSSSSGSNSNNVSYHQEISSMIYVFTSIKPPQPSSTTTNVTMIQFIQDVVQSELIHLLLLAKQQASRTNNLPLSPPTPTSTTSTSSATTTSTTSVKGSNGSAIQPQQPQQQQQPVQISIEDVLFVIRQETDKVERLKSYLSWKDVRKKTRAEPTTTTTTNTGGGDEDEIDGIEEPDKNLKIGKSLIHLSWELGDPWREYLLDNTSSSNSSSVENGIGGGGVLSKEEERAYKINREILREANEMTEKMTREEYEQYSLARQASFVYRKSKKFRDFLLLDTATTLTDELLDIFGFLAYELVRTLSRVGIVQARNRLLISASSQRQQQLELDVEEKKEKRKRKEGEIDGEKKGDLLDPNSKDFPSVLRPGPTTQKRRKNTSLEPIISLFSAPIESESTTIEERRTQEDTTTTSTKEPLPSFTIDQGAGGGGGSNGSKKPPQPVVVVKSLELKDLQNGFWHQTHHSEYNGNDNVGGDSNGSSKDGSKIKMGKSLKSWRGGLGAVRGNRNNLF